MANIRDAIRGYLDSLKKHGEPIPRGITEAKFPHEQAVKLDPALFVRLKTFSAKTRRTNQDILSTALTEYLNASMNKRVD